MDEYDEYDEDDDGLLRNCPNCQREYDAIDYEYQICHICGHEAKEEVQNGKV